MATGTKEKIKSTALRMLANEGYGSTSIRKIAKIVGIRESAIYNHFSSKDEIVKAILTDLKKETNSVELLTEDLLDLISKPEKFLRKFCSVLVNKWCEGRQINYFRFMISEEFRESEIELFSLREMIDDLRRVWEMIFTQMTNFGYIKKNDTKVLADEFIAPLFFIRTEHLSNERDLERSVASKKIENHINFFWNSIKK